MRASEKWRSKWPVRGNPEGNPPSTQEEAIEGLIADLRIAEERAEKANEGWLAQAERDAKEIVRLEVEASRLREELADYRAYYNAKEVYGKLYSEGQLSESIRCIEARKEKGNE